MGLGKSRPSEIELDVKASMKGFYRYISSKRKTRENMNLPLTW